jgi:2-aminoadipate transaminase
MGLLPDNTVMLGSFSKIIIPGFRLGWIVANRQIMEKLIVAKQAADLLTSHFTQSIVFQYLSDNDIDRHIGMIRNAYGIQCRAMLDSIQKDFPPGVKCTKPEGGMFTWAELPPGVSSLDLFKEAVRENVVFVPGDPFYVNRTGTQTLRLNFSCVNEKTIVEGIRRLAGTINKLLSQPY